MSDMTEPVLSNLTRSKSLEVIQRTSILTRRNYFQNTKEALCKLFASAPKRFWTIRQRTHHFKFKLFFELLSLIIASPSLCEKVKCKSCALFENFNLFANKIKRIQYPFLSWGMLLNAHAYKVVESGRNIQLFSIPSFSFFLITTKWSFGIEIK